MKQEELKNDISRKSIEVILKEKGYISVDVELDDLPIYLKKNELIDLIQALPISTPSESELVDEVLKVWNEDGDNGEIQMKTPIAWHRVLMIAEKLKQESLKRVPISEPTQSNTPLPSDEGIDLAAELYEKFCQERNLPLEDEGALMGMLIRIQSQYQQTSLNEVAVTQEQEIKGILVHFMREGTNGDYLDALNNAIKEIEALKQQVSKVSE